MRYVSSNKKHRMTESQVRKFVNRIAPSWKIKVTFFTDRAEYAYGAWMHVHQGETASLRVNRDIDGNPRVLLMHELGHCFGDDPHNSSSVKNELSAQRWAIQKSKELGMNSIAQELEDQLYRSWLKYKWNTGYRRYVLAARLAITERQHEFQNTNINPHINNM